MKSSSFIAALVISLLFCCFLCGVCLFCSKLPTFNNITRKKTNSGDKIKKKRTQLLRNIVCFLNLVEFFMIFFLIPETSFVTIFWIFFGLAELSTIFSLPKNSNAVLILGVL
jgi:hypothetical protein